MNRLIGLAIAALLTGVLMSIVVSDSVQAQTLQDRNTEAARLLQQGIKLYQAGRYQEAIQAFESSLGIYRQIGNPNGEAASLLSLGKQYESLRQYQKAIEYYGQSLDIQIFLRSAMACSI